MLTLLSSSYLFRRSSDDIDLLGTLSEMKHFIEPFRMAGLIGYAYPTSAKNWVYKLTRPVTITIGDFTFNPIVIEFEIAYSGEEDSSNIINSLKNVESIKTIDTEFTTDDIAILTARQHLALKLSHRYLKNSPHFLKTMSDIKALRKMVSSIDYAYDSDVNTDYSELIKTREAETYTYKHPKLNVSKNEFFNGDGVEYVYDHDSIHVAIADILFKRPPAYTYFTNESVFSSKELFDALPDTVKISAVYEEAVVLAIERAVVPFSTDPEKAFLMALEKVCTSITSGWFREFAYENYDKVLQLNKETYWYSAYLSCVDKSLFKKYDETSIHI